MSEFESFSNASASAFLDNLFSTIPEGMTLGDYVPEEILEYLHPAWYRFPVIQPLFYYGMGLAWLIGGILSLVGNGMVLYIFGKTAALRSPANVLVMNLAFCDFMLMACLVPEFVVNCVMGGVWQFGYLACMVHAFSGSLLGYAQIITLVFISYDRYTVIVKGFQAKRLTYTGVFAYLVFIWLYATGWAVAPLYGWGQYTLDGILTECSFDYMSRDFSNVSFIWSVSVANYILPLIIIVLAYYDIAKAVFAHEKSLRDQAKKMNVASLRSNKDVSSQSAEIRIAKVAMINVSLWVIAWTPFAVITLIGVSGDQELITPLIGSLTVVFAKTSCIYNPIVYAISHPKYRQALEKEFPRLFPKSKKVTLTDVDTGGSEVTKASAAGTGPPDNASV